MTTTRPVGAAYWVDEPQIRVERFLTSGDPDPDFGSDGVAEFEPVPNMRDTYVYDVALLADGRVLLLISPRPNYGQTGPGVLLLMLTADGSVDTGFADAGYLIPDFSPWACQGVKPYLREIEVNSAGTIVALAQRDSYYSCPRLGLVAQFDSQGNFVDAFGSSWRPLPNSGHYFAGLIDIDTQNSVLLHDYTADVAVRLAADGDPDPQFTPVPVPEQTNTSSSVFVDGYTGAIVVTAQAWGVLENGQDAATVDFYLPDGTPDPARPQAANPIPTVFEWGGYHNLKFRPNGEMVALDHTSSYLLLSATGEPVTDLRYSATGPEESWLFDLDSTGRMYRFDEHLNGRDSVVTRVAELGPVSEFSPECLAKMVECFAPHVLFHPDERFFPMNVDDFIDGSVVKWQACAGVAELVNANPTPNNLNYMMSRASSLDVWNWGALAGDFCTPDGDSRLYRANEFTRPFSDRPSNTSKSKAEAPTVRAEIAGPADPSEGFVDREQGFFLEWEDTLEWGEGAEFYDGLPHGGARVADTVDGQGEMLQAPIYYEVDVRDGVTTIGYYMFYGYDPKAAISNEDVGGIFGDDPIVNPVTLIDGVTAHQGDWERITVIVPSGGAGVTVEYSRHGCDPLPVAWGGVKKSGGTHPLVYVAEGSHASYPDERLPGPAECEDEIPGDVTGRSDEAVFVEGESVEWRPWASTDQLQLNRQCWFGFGGAWGETRHVSLLTLLTDLRGDATGPVGPPYNSRIRVEEPPESIESSCAQPMGNVISGLADRWEWSETQVLEAINTDPELEMVWSLHSIPVVIARTRATPDGELKVPLSIPVGTPPGSHTIIGQDATTGETLFSASIWVDVPPDCLADDAVLTAGGVDFDGDALVDSCDPDLTDGPLADFDADGIINMNDNCVSVANPDQAAAYPARAVGLVCDERAGANTVDQLISTDTTPPQIDVTIDPAPNPAGWNNSVVTVTPTCTDIEGPIQSCSAPVEMTAEGADQSLTFTAVDAVANTATLAVDVSIDLTAPTLTITGPADGSTIPVGDYQTPSCDSTDGLSGLNGVCTITITEQSTTPGTVTRTATAAATDRAGNTAQTSITFTVVLDLDAPDLVATANHEPNDAGWHSSAVTYTFACTDASGVASCPTPITLNAEGSNQSIDVEATDIYGNTAELTISGINIDTTPPTVSITAPPSATPAEQLHLTCIATDQLSGIDATDCASIEIIGTSLEPESNTFTFSATDQAGNTTQASVTVDLIVTTETLRELIAVYLGDTPGAAGLTNALIAKIDNNELDAFTNQIWAKCCTPHPGKRFTAEQANTLINLATYLLEP